MDDLLFRVHHHRVDGVNDPNHHLARALHGYDGVQDPVRLRHGDNDKQRQKFHTERAPLERINYFLPLLLSLAQFLPRKRRQQVFSVLVRIPNLQFGRKVAADLDRVIG